MPRLTLSILEEFPFLVYGISSTDRDYRLCWGINKTLGLSLKLEKPVEVINKAGYPAEHALYTCMYEPDQVKYRLVENKAPRSLFLPEVPKADFLLIIDESPMIEPDEILSDMRKIRSVLMIFPVDLDSLKTKQNILLTA